MPDFKDDVGCTARKSCDVMHGRVVGFVHRSGGNLTSSTQQRYDFLDFMLCCRRINTLLECSSIRKRIIIKGQFITKNNENFWENKSCL